MKKILLLLLLISTNVLALDVNQGNPNENDDGRLVVKQWHQDIQDRVLAAADSSGIINMAIDAQFSGTPEKIHNGTDDALWTAAAVSGTWDFASTTEAYAGTKSIDGILTVNGSVCKLTNGVITANYTAITGWIKVTNWTATSMILVYAWDTTANIQVGNSIDIGDHINDALIGEWQQFILPTSEMDLSTTTIHELRLQTISLGQAPNYYIDDLQFEEAGTPIQYSLQPRDNTVFVLESLSFIIFNPSLDLSTPNASVSPIDYKNFFGLTLTTGLNYELIENGITQISININDLGDLLFFQDLKIFNLTSSNDHSFINLRIPTTFTTPVFRSDLNDKFLITIQDDFSSLDGLYLVATGTEIPLEDYLKGNY